MRSFIHWGKNKSLEGGSKENNSTWLHTPVYNETT